MEKSLFLQLELSEQQATQVIQEVVNKRIGARRRLKNGNNCRECGSNCRETRGKCQIWEKQWVKIWQRVEKKNCFSCRDLPWRPEPELLQTWGVRGEWMIGVIWRRAIRSLYPKEAIPSFKVPKLISEMTTIFNWLWHAQSTLNRI